MHSGDGAENGKIIGARHVVLGRVPRINETNKFLRRIADALDRLVPVGVVNVKNRVLPATVKSAGVSMNPPAGATT